MPRPDASVASHLPPLPLIRSSEEGPAEHIDWIKDFDRQRALTPATPLSQAARALVPPGEARVVAWGVERHMALTQPNVGRFEDMIRVVTPARGKALRAGVVRHLRRLGYPVIDTSLVSPVTHPEHGVLSIKITEPTALAARVEFVLERFGLDAATPMADPLPLMNRPLAWLDGVAHTPIGYELQHFHAVRFQGAFTDAQRVAYAIRVNDLPAVQTQLIARAKAADYVPVAREGALYRTTDGRMFTMRATDEPGVLVLHVSERWPVSTPKAAPASK